MNDLVSDIQRHWGELTRDEILDQAESLNSLADYISKRYHAPTQEVRRTLRQLQENHQSGHPKLNDHFAGTDRAQGEESSKGIITDSLDQESLEWQAREDINRGNERSNPAR